MLIGEIVSALLMSEVLKAQGLTNLVALHIVMSITHVFLDILLLLGVLKKKVEDYLKYLEKTE